ncbi:MAG: S8 family serine peptidase [bacterium]|nr:S8 family serine peptidase [bacterium]
MPPYGLRTRCQEHRRQPALSILQQGSGLVDAYEAVYSTVTGCAKQDNYGEETYLELSGTSMAAAMTSGAVALMLDKDPSLSPDDVKARLMRSARKIDGDITVVGAGVLDIDAALDEIGAITGSAQSPFMSLSDGEDAVMVQDTAAIWGGEE